jgi:hypothetical protein
VTNDETEPPLLRFRGWYTPNLVVMPHDTDPRARQIATDIGQAARGAPGGNRIRVELDDRGMATLVAGRSRLGPIQVGDVELARAARSQRQAMLTVLNRPIPAEVDAVAWCTIHTDEALWLTMLRSP